MDFSEYQKESRKTAIYWDAGKNIIYPTLGLAGETGEVIEKIKKLMRNEKVTSAEEVSEEKKAELEKELGDVLWYIAQLATEFRLDLDAIATKNLEKLNSRMERGTLHSEGDDR
jgi:NTP pyrophosphatase (non-canonical NTP hydrolase)